MDPPSGRLETVERADNSLDTALWWFGDILIFSLRVWWISGIAAAVTAAIAAAPPSAALVPNASTEGCWQKSAGLVLALANSTRDLNGDGGEEDRDGMQGYSIPEHQVGVLRRPEAKVEKSKILK